MHPTIAARRSELLAIALLSLLSAALFAESCRLWWPHYADDSYITLRYAQNWADGHGPVFNPGERVEGYSNPAWMALLRGAIALDLDPISASKWIGVGAGLLLLVSLGAALVAAGVPGWVAATLPMLLASCEIYAAWAVSGMETLAYSLFLFVGLVLLLAPRDASRATLAASAALVVAALTRPEGIAFWLGGLGFRVCIQRRRAWAYLAPGLVLLAHFVWRHHYYGDWLPNTYYARVGMSAGLWNAGFWDLARFLLGFHPAYFLSFQPIHALWLLAAGVGAWIAARRGARQPVLLMTGFVAFYLVYIASVGGDSLGFFRYHVPILAPLAYLLGLGLRGAADDPRKIARVPLALVFAAAGISLYSTALMHDEDRIRLRGRFDEGNEKLGRQLAASRAPDTWIAVGAAGAIPYFSGLPTIDLFGLSDRHIARQARVGQESSEFESFVGHAKFDLRYVLSRRPQIVVLNEGYFPADWESRWRRLEEQPMLLASVDPLNLAIFEHFYWNPAYEFRPIVFDDGGRFYVFERVEPRAGER